MSLNKYRNTNKKLHVMKTRVMASNLLMKELSDQIKVIFNLTNIKTPR